MRGQNKVWEDIISDTLGVKPMHINSALVSAQNRDRLYWTNIPGVTIPDDRFIYIDDIIPDARNGYGFGGVKDKITGKYVYPWTERRDHKAACLVKRGNRDYVIFNDNTFRKLTTTEKEVLQTLPAGYTDVPGVSKTIREAGIGNGWTVEVIKHILSFIPEFEKV
jgi:DNA (cytosine-5)-methyltransferase 3A